MQNLLAASAEEALVNVPIAIMGRDASVQAAMGNAVAYVMESKRLLLDFLSLLLGKSPEGFFNHDETASIRQTRYFRDKKGILGHCQASVVITEDHNKGTLHYHMLMAGGLNAYVLQCFHAITELTSTISSALDKMQSASLCDQYLITNALCKVLRNDNTYEFKLQKELHIPSQHLLERNNLASILNQNTTITYSTFCDTIINQVRTQQVHEHM